MRLRGCESTEGVRSCCSVFDIQLLHLQCSLVQYCISCDQNLVGRDTVVHLRPTLRRRKPSALGRKVSSTEAIPQMKRSDAPIFGSRRPQVPSLCDLDTQKCAQPHAQHAQARAKREAAAREMPKREHSQETPTHATPQHERSGQTAARARREAIIHCA